MTGRDQISLFIQPESSRGRESSAAPGIHLEESIPGIASLVFSPATHSVNVLTRAVLERLGDLVAAIRGSSHFRGVLVTSTADGSFVAGADVNEIASVTDPSVGREASTFGQRIFSELADLPIPVVVAINGTCLGGGTELAFSCHYRVASDSPRVRIGLPEVRLGIVPGFGGTQRLPRLVGLPRGLDLVLTSRNLDARRAQRIGLVDLVVPQVIFEREARRFVELAASGGAPARGVPAFGGAERARARRAKIPLRDRLLETRLGAPLLFRATRKQVLARTKGHYPAPLVAMDVMRDGFRKPLPEALALEARAVADLLGTPEKRALVHVFFLNEANRRDRGSTDAEIAPAPIRRAGLVGAGAMGGGIAQLLSQREIPARMRDLNDAALLGGLRHAESVYGGLVRRHKLRAADARHRMALIEPTLDYTGFGRADIVFEAVVEKMDVKKTVLAEVESVAPPHAIFATNTSALSVTELAEGSARPAQVAGFHFFNPVHRMPLVEVVRGRRTSDQTIVTLMALARRLGKTPILVGDGPGFLVNRVLGRYMNEASHLLAGGVPAERIDRVAVAFGMPMGPIRLIDEVGVDVAAKVAAVLVEKLGPRYQTNNLLERLEGAGRLGKKSGVGLYRHPKGKKDPKVDPGVVRFIETGGRRFVGSDREVRDRLLLGMVDEAARCLDERLVRGPGDVDIGMIFGTGFPPFRGGLLRFADELGIGLATDALTRLSETISPRFSPCDRLKDMAAHAKTFY